MRSNDKHDRPERDWLAALTAGDKAAWDAFVDRYAGVIHGTVRRILGSTGVSADVIAERLGLDSDQRAIFDRVRAEARADARSFSAEASATVNPYWAEMVAEAPDPALLEQYLAQAAERNLAFNRVITKRMRTFLAALGPTQRQEFVDRVRARPVLRGRFLMTGG